MFKDRRKGSSSDFYKIKNLWKRKILVSPSTYFNFLSFSIHMRGLP